MNRDEPGLGVPKDGDLKLRVNTDTFTVAFRFDRLSIKSAQARLTEKGS